MNLKPVTILMHGPAFTEQHETVAREVPMADIEAYEKAGYAVDEPALEQNDNYWKAKYLAAAETVSMLTTQVRDLMKTVADTQRQLTDFERHIVVIESSRPKPKRFDKGQAAYLDSIMALVRAGTIRQPDPPGYRPGQWQ